MNGMSASAVELQKYLSYWDKYKYIWENDKVTRGGGKGLPSELRVLIDARSRLYFLLPLDKSVCPP